MKRPPLGLTSRCEIVRVIDGDTVVVRLTREIHVRLEDCWAPETRTRNAQEKIAGRRSAAHLRMLLPEGSHATVTLNGDADGQLADVITLGRMVGRIWPDGQDTDVSTLQVAHGHATPTKTEKPAA